MKISGFSMCRNADALYYPVVESITSALPLVDEFVIAIGKGAAHDRTLELVKSIGSEKVRIIETEWDTHAFPFGTVHAQQSNLAKQTCTGDWLLYLQADEVLHEKDHDSIRQACALELENKEVDGFLLQFLHFWGDYDHVQQSHSWYDKEIRIVRNDPDIHSWQSAQSFRRIPGFDGKNYRQSENTFKLRVKELEACVYHYGWVRPPQLMKEKINALDEIHSHPVPRQLEDFSFGALGRLPVFEATHPAVMAQRIASMDWKPKEDPEPAYIRHKRPTDRLLTWVEQKVLGGRKIFHWKNYTLIR